VRDQELHARVAHHPRKLTRREALPGRGDEALRAELHRTAEVELDAHRLREGLEVGHDLHAVLLAATRGETFFARRIEHHRREAVRDLVRVQPAAPLEIERVERLFTRGARRVPRLAEKCPGRLVEREIEPLAPEVVDPAAHPVVDVGIGIGLASATRHALAIFREHPQRLTRRALAHHLGDDGLVLGYRDAYCLGEQTYRHLPGACIGVDRRHRVDVSGCCREPLRLGRRELRSHAQPLGDRPVAVAVPPVQLVELGEAADRSALAA